MGGNGSNPQGGTVSDGPTMVRSEDVLVRNHDFQWGYDLEVEIHDDDGVVFEERYYLQPGAAKSELDVLTPGVYAVQVVLDNKREETTECRIGGEPDEGVLVELGNGAVSVHDRLSA